MHRDIKPENILLVDKNLTVKVADFGMAKYLAEEGEKGITRTLLGTPSCKSIVWNLCGYRANEFDYADVAPEILSGDKSRLYSYLVDIWSAGVVLYICLCGFPPFSDELYSKDFPYTLSQQIKSGRFDYPSPYWDDVGDPALDLIDSMLVVDAEKRFTAVQCQQHPWMAEDTSSGP